MVGGMSSTARPPDGADHLTDAQADVVRRAIADALPRAAGSPHDHLGVLAAARVAVVESDRRLRQAVESARGAGHGWDAVGRLLDLPAQAARQRFETAGAGDGPGGPEPVRRTLDSLTAFGEMAALDREAEAGWHSVGHGTGYHVLEASPWQWEHRRVMVAIGARHRRMTDEGWQLVGSEQLPWAYYKRRTDRPARS